MFFVQLRTLRRLDSDNQQVLVYACCSALNPFYLMFPHGEKFWYMRYLHSSEPKILYIVDLDNVLVYVFFCTAPNLVPSETKTDQVLVYVFFARLRTGFLMHK